MLVALVEDNANLRQHFVERFRFFEDVKLVFSAGSGEECLTKMAALPMDEQPAVVLIDIELPGISGIETTRQLTAEYPNIDVMMLTVFEHEEKIFAAIQAGASGYLLKDESTDIIVGALLELQRGGAPMSPAVARKLMHFVREADPQSEQTPTETFNLSDRERELLGHLINDETDAQIADRMHISPHTVRTHIKNIYKKLHVHSRAGAGRVTLEQKLLKRRPR